MYGWPMSTQAPAQDETQDAYLDTSQLSRWEYLGMASGVLLFVSLFLPWFTTGSNRTPRSPRRASARTPTRPPGRRSRSWTGCCWR